MSSVATAGPGRSRQTTSGWAIALGHGLVDVQRGPQHYGEQAFGFDEGVLPGTPDESYSIDIGAYGSTAYPARHAASAGRTAGVRLSGSTTCDVADRLRLRDNDNAVYYMDPTCGPQQWRERRWSSPDHDDSHTAERLTGIWGREQFLECAAAGGVTQDCITPPSVVHACGGVAGPRCGGCPGGECARATAA